MIKKLFCTILMIILSISTVGCNADTVSTEKEIFDVIIKELDTDIEVK